MGLFYCFDFTGEQLGRFAFDAGITLIARMGDGFLIGLANGKAHWLQLDATGAIQSATPWKTDGDWEHAVSHDDALLVPTEQGLATTTLSVEN